MTKRDEHTFVGFGFGPIQAGLFLHEAKKSGNFGHFVVAHRDGQVVEQIRAAGGIFFVNVAHTDRVEQVQVGPITILHTGSAADRRQLIQHIAEADEIATAISNVDAYMDGGEAAVHTLLAAGIRRKQAHQYPPAIVYASENHNHAAQILEQAVTAEIPDRERREVQAQVQFLNTVIGKMSGRVRGADRLQAHKLAPVVSNADWGFLVESFNHILIEPVRFSTQRFQRGIVSFEEKPNLLPFEEAKLYGHNATHALAAYIGALTKCRRISDLRSVTGMYDFLIDAFVLESGSALVRKYGGIDPLFTPKGYSRYAQDLLQRMTNPFLLDTVERVGRDPVRKLGWNDRLIGVMRLALSQQRTPRRFAIGAAAALIRLDPDLLMSQRTAADLLLPLWCGDIALDERTRVIALVEESLNLLRRWQQMGRPPLLEFLQVHGTLA